MNSRGDRDFDGVGGIVGNDVDRLAVNGGLPSGVIEGHQHQPIGLRSVHPDSARLGRPRQHLHLAGPRVSELAGEAALAIEMGATLDDLALTIHPHPSFSEAIAESAWGALGSPLHVLRASTKHRAGRPLGS